MYRGHTSLTTVRAQAFVIQKKLPIFLEAKYVTSIVSGIDRLFSGYNEYLILLLSLKWYIKNGKENKQQSYKVNSVLKTWKEMFMIHYNTEWPPP